MENELIKRIELKETQEKKRAFLLIFIPLLVGILFIAFTSYEVIKSENKIKVVQKELNDASKKLKEVQFQNNILKGRYDSLTTVLKKSIVTFGVAVNVIAQFKKIVDKIEPELRSQEEATFFVNYNMLLDRVKSDYNYLSKNVAKLPKVDDKNVWSVTVKKNMSLDDLKKEAPRLISIYGKDQIGIFKDSVGSYELRVKGNGTFTRAYRLVVELRDKYHYDNEINGPGFSTSNDWNKNYLK